MPWDTFELELNGRNISNQARQAMMSDDVLLDAFHQWCITTVGIRSRDLPLNDWVLARREFLEITGLPELGAPDKVRNKKLDILEKMAGPHGHTYCKLLQARAVNGEDGTEQD